MSAIVIPAKFLVVKKFLDFLESKIEIEDLGIKEGIKEAFEEFVKVNETDSDSDVVEEPSDKENVVIDEEKPKKKVVKKTKVKNQSDDDAEEPKKIKKTREPTFYNLFTRNHTVIPKESGRGMYAKAMAELWKESEEGQFFSEKCKELKKENPDKSNEQIYEMVNKKWQEIVMANEEQHFIVNSDDEEEVGDFSLGEA